MGRCGEVGSQGSAAQRLAAVAARHEVFSEWGR
jgi:hypothetical protein